MASMSGDESVPVSNRRATIIGVTLVFQVLATVAVLLRLYARLKLVNSPGWDDLCIIIASLTMTLGSTTISLGTDYGLGHHIYDIGQEELGKYLLFFYIMNASYVLSTGFIKLSILFQYLRVFEKRFVRTICKILLIFTALWCAAFAFMAWVPCFPVRAYWDLSVTSYTCYGYGSRNTDDFVNTYLVQGSLDIFLDYFIYLIPIPIIARQNLTKRERIGFLALMALGLIVCIVSTYRLATLVGHRNATNDYDWSWYSPITDVMSTLEVNIAVIAASIPIFWPIIESGLGGISITQEIHITRQYHRQDDSDVEMEDGGGTRESGSSSELHQKESAPTSYRDTFVSFEPVNGSKVGSAAHVEGPLKNPG